MKDKSSTEMASSHIGYVFFSDSGTSVSHVGAELSVYRYHALQTQFALKA